MMAVHATNPRSADLIRHCRHDLRNKVNVIVCLTEVLREDAREQGRLSLQRRLVALGQACNRFVAKVDQELGDRSLSRLGGQRRSRWLSEVGIQLERPLEEISIQVVDLVTRGGLDRDETTTQDLSAMLEASRALGVLLNELTAYQPGAALPPQQEVNWGPGYTTFSTEALTPQPHRPVGRILVVDDDEPTRELLRRILIKCGHLVHVEVDPERVLTGAREGGFDLILLDLVMPGMSGYELLAALRGDPATARTSVIILSGVDEAESVVASMELGADDYIQKPLNAVAMRARVEACLERKRLRDREHAALEQLRKEREKSERLLLNILPRPVAERLKRGERVIADRHPDVTVLFADLVGFTRLTTEVDSDELIAILSGVFGAFDGLVLKHGLEKIKTIGDAYMAAGGLHQGSTDHPARVAQLALDMRSELDRYNLQHGRGLGLRIGLATGPVIAGVIGSTKFSYDLWGDTVNTASRMESTCPTGEVQLTEEVSARLPRHFIQRERGEIQVKGKGGMQVFLLDGV